MFEKEVDLQTLFPPREEAEWRAAVEKGLGGRSLEEKLVHETYEGLRVQPLYHEDNARRGPRAVASFPQQGELRQEFEHPDPEVVGRQSMVDLARGVDSVQLRLDRALRRGERPDSVEVAEDGIALHDRAAMEVCLSAAREETPVALVAGASWAAAATTLLAALRARQHAPTGCLGADPIGSLAAEGALLAPAEVELERMADLARWCHEHAPGLRAVAVDDSAYHHAGSHEALDLGLMASTGVAYLKALVASGLSPTEAAAQLLFRVRLDSTFFLGIAKLRALRRIWARVASAVGADASTLRVQARCSERVLTRRDPWVNILRNASAGFAAAVGGADVFTSEPFDRRLGVPDDFGRRLARNSQILLEEESHLRRVVDPAGGSWFLEDLSSQLAEAGWKQLQALEAEGGVLAALRSGFVARRIETGEAARAENLARRRDPITGVSEFANLDERPPVHDEPDRPSLRERVHAASKHAVEDLPVPGDGAWTARLIAAVEEGATLDDLNSALREAPETGEVLPLRPFAREYEALRDASDAHRQARGGEPRVFLATLGVMAEYNPRATWVGNALRAGGLRPQRGGDLSDAAAVVEAYRAASSPVAVLCSTDEIYAERAVETAHALKEAGARRVLLAGRPGEREEAERAAGVDGYLHLGCDLLSVLRDLHEVLEVRR